MRYTSGVHVIRPSATSYFHPPVLEIDWVSSSRAWISSSRFRPSAVSRRTDAVTYDEMYTTVRNANRFVKEVSTGIPGIRYGPYPREVKKLAIDQSRREKKETERGGRRSAAHVMGTRRTQGRPNIERGVDGSPGEWTKTNVVAAHTTIAIDNVSTRRSFGIFSPDRMIAAMERRSGVIRIIPVASDAHQWTNAAGNDGLPPRPTLTAAPKIADPPQIARAQKSRKRRKSPVPRAPAFPPVMRPSAQAAATDSAQLTAAYATPVAGDIPAVMFAIEMDANTAATVGTRSFFRRISSATGNRPAAGQKAANPSGRTRKKNPISAKR